MNVAQKILVEKAIGWIGVLCVGGFVLIVACVLLSALIHGIQEAAWLLEEYFADEEAVLTYGLVALAGVCFWSRAYLRAGRLGS
ncbi:hypothetical protein [Stutzerimonas stutzeri]|uniref:hypothetical protein n=1 Tax=Stutzerimonas stutzeri TaxID=316 RepID=UPI000360E3AB|nr:hypothetical protein [Stutzerimonas stutzeri]